MLNLNGLDIVITQGDTGSIRVTFTGTDTPEDGATALVTVKSDPSKEAVVWEKEITVTNSGCVIPLTAEDTSIQTGVYRWDLRLIYTDGSVYTPMKPARFTVMDAVGNVEAVSENEQ